MEKKKLLKRKKILQIMLLNKVIHYLETLGAVALSIIETKSKRTNERFNKQDEKGKFVTHLSSYKVGDVVNFYRNIKKRQTVKTQIMVNNCGIIIHKNKP